MPIIAIAVFAYIYVVQPAYMMSKDMLDAFLTDGMIVKGLVLPALALFCMMWGWRRGDRGAAKNKEGDAPKTPMWDADRLYRYGMGAAVIGTVLHLIWIQRSGGVTQAYGQIHGQGVETEGFTAYIWMGSFWALTGVAMMILSGAKRRLTPAQHTAIAIFAGAYALSGLLFSSRTSIFAILAVVWVSHSLAKKSRPSIDRAAPALALACLGVLLMIGYRSVLYLSSDQVETPTWTEAVTTGLGSDTDVKYGTSGVEFVVHSLILKTVDETHRYDTGLSWLEVCTVHMIPRVWWHDKPVQGNWPYWSPLGPKIDKEDILDVTGIMLATGSSPGIVAEAYENFGLFALVFFLLLGWAFRRFLFHAENNGSPFTMCAYTMAFALSLNVFAQGFVMLIVPMVYSMAPVFLYYWGDRINQQRMAQAKITIRPFRAAQVRPPA